MADQKIVIVLTRGLDDERSSVAWSIANTAVSSGFEATMFLVSAGADWARKSSAEIAHLNPADPPIGEMINNFMSQGGQMLVCPPCAKVRGYTQEDLIEGAVLAGAPAMLEKVQQGASTLSF